MHDLPPISTFDAALAYRHRILNALDHKSTFQPLMTLYLTESTTFHEIEKAAGHTVAEIFEKFGEDDFRKGERRGINRLLNQGENIVLGTGGGAFMDEQTRGRLKLKTLVIWLRVDIDILVERTSRRDTRPLLQKGNPQDIFQKLADERHPVYEESHIVVESGQSPHDVVVNDIIWQINKYLASDKNNQSEPEN